MWSSFFDKEAWRNTLAGSSVACYTQSVLTRFFGLTALRVTGAISLFFAVTTTHSIEARSISLPKSLPTSALFHSAILMLTVLLAEQREGDVNVTTAQLYQLSGNLCLLLSGFVNTFMGEEEEAIVAPAITRIDVQPMDEKKVLVEPVIKRLEIQPHPIVEIRYKKQG